MERVAALAPAVDIAALAHDLTPPKAVLFDWDNTLVDTWPCIGRATNITLETMGHPDADPKLIGRNIHVMLTPLPPNKRKPKFHVRGDAEPDDEHDSEHDSEQGP